MNPHFVAGRRRSRRYHPVCPTSLFIRGQPILEELFVRASSLRGLHVLSVRLESRGGEGEVGARRSICMRMGRCGPAVLRDPQRTAGTAPFLAAPAPPPPSTAQRSAAAGETGTRRAPGVEAGRLPRRLGGNERRGLPPAPQAPFPGPFPQRLKKKKNKK